MLSPHEIAALMVLGSLGSCRDIDPKDIAALATRRLIETSQGQASHAARLTPSGFQLLSAVTRGSRSRTSPLQPASAVGLGDSSVRKH